MILQLMLERLPVAAALIGCGGSVSFANTSALRILESRDGLRLRAPPYSSAGMGNLYSDRPRVQMALTSAADDVVNPDIRTAEHFTRSVCVPRLSVRSSYHVQFSSLPFEHTYGIDLQIPRAIVYVTDLVAPLRINIKLIREIYDLTSAEARAAVALAEGGTVLEVAKRLGVSINTLKSQIGNIYSKTDVRCRAQLVRVLCLMASRA